MNKNKRLLHTIFIFSITFFSIYLTLSLITNAKKQFAYSDNQLNLINKCSDELSKKDNMEKINLNTIYYNDETALFVNYYDNDNLKMVYGLINFNNNNSNIKNCYSIGNEIINYDLKNINGIQNIVIKEDILYYATSKTIYNSKSYKYTIYRYNLLSQENEIYLSDIIINSDEEFNLENYVSSIDKTINN